MNVDHLIYDFPLRLGPVAICWISRTSGPIGFVESPSFRHITLVCRSSSQYTTTGFLPTSFSGYSITCHSSLLGAWKSWNMLTSAVFHQYFLANWTRVLCHNFRLSHDSFICQCPTTVTKRVTGFFLNIYFSSSFMFCLE